LAGSGIDGLKINSEAFSDALTVASGGITGGISSTIAGGDFWRGMRHGLITTGLNHTLHKFTTPIFDNGDDPPKNKSAKNKGVKNKVIKQNNIKSMENFRSDFLHEGPPILVRASVVEGSYITEGEGSITRSTTFVNNNISSVSLGVSLFNFFTPQIGFNAVGSVSSGFSIKLFGSTYTITNTPDIINKTYTLSFFRDSNNSRHGVQIESGLNRRTNRFNIRPNPDFPILVPVLSPSPIKFRF